MNAASGCIATTDAVAPGDLRKVVRVAASGRADLRASVLSARRARVLAIL